LEENVITTHHQQCKCPACDSKEYLKDQLTQQQNQDTIREHQKLQELKALGSFSIPVVIR
jgi:hypothetical protein